MPQVRDAQGRFTRMQDGLANLVTGAGTTADKRTHAFYTRPFMLPEQIESAYRSSWMMKKGINLPAKDMTRKRRSWQIGEDSVDLIEKEEKRLGLWPKLKQALILGRLGGGLIIMGVGNDDPSTPLPANSPRGSLRYLHVMNRWQVGLGAKVLDPTDPLYGQPAYFQIRYGAAGKAGQVNIHPSRVVAFKGEAVPNLHGSAGDDWFWGDSLVLSVIDAVKNAEGTINGFSSLIDEAKVDTVSIPGLTAILATAQGEQNVLKRISIANQMKSMHNTRILDSGADGKSGETWETRQVAWSGMPDMIRVQAAIVASAFDIPATRFLGKAPDGMNATGDGDESNYAAKISTDQDEVLRPALDQIDAVLLPSAGVSVDDECSYDFPPMHEMSELDTAKIFGTRIDAITKLEALKAIPAIAFEKALQHTAVENGWMDGLDGALDEVPEGERFPSESAEEMGPDGEPITSSEGDGKEVDPNLAGAAGANGSALARRAANDALTILRDAGVTDDVIARLQALAEAE